MYYQSYLNKNLRYMKSVSINNNFIYMSTTQQTRARAVSARPAPRPTSGKSKKIHQKTQFIQNLYGSHNPHNNYHSFHKNKLFAMRSNVQQNDLQDFSKLMPKPEKIPKERQQLFEENLHLKKQLHKMKDQLVKNRTKIQSLASKNQKYTKQFNREFEKKIYWNGNNTYLISGIKAQYEKLKEELELKQQENQTLKRELIESRAPEYKIYAEALQEQNKKLADKVSRMGKISQNALFESSNDKRLNEFQIAQLQTQNEKLQAKVEELSYDLKLAKEENKDVQKKIQFLQKLLIEKDNAQYHAMKKLKKLERQRNTIDERVKFLEGENQDISKNYQAKIEKLKILEEKRFKAEKDIFDRALNEKEAKIQKLQKQVAYLSTLLTYWKPLDELKDYSIENNESHAHQFNQSRKQENNIKKKGEDLFRPESAVLNNSQRIRRPSQFSQKGEFVLNKTSVEIPQQMKDSIKISQNKSIIRVQQTADQRHSEEAQKRRKVDYKEVEHLGQHLRYRFLGLRLEINQVRKYFDYQKVASNPESNFILSENVKSDEGEQNKWQQQYITMRETKQILKNYPFELTQDQSHLLARYMIQDSNKEHVYVDLNNEHKRSVVKSILKALVGNYEILQGDRQLQVQKQCQEMLDKYQTNLISALSTMASSGYISRRKFLQLLNSLGIELSEQGRDFLVCRMLLKSQSLNKLNYMIIFQ